ncbi:hypothetical protein [Mangrovimonas xylaniphaga]|uniref:hypothetical protein n=1 Tax=Mangrovimonas xylaniphaga TaxID=1645915 RepID=UPI0006B6719A|nr:hypothetical protein [Mangrovimonas xylaniphaga]
MKHHLLCSLLVFFSIRAFSQITFEQGYYIDNTGNKIECYIKNSDWKNSPSEFKYKHRLEGDVKTGTLESVKEFGIYNSFKYIKRTVAIDVSKVSLENLDYNRSPILETKELFLKVLVEGNANLFSYVDGKLRRYFFNKMNDPITQLIYKTFKVSEYKTQDNNEFKEQLRINLTCPDFTIEKIRKLEYNQKDLSAFFVAYNSCQNSTSTVYKRQSRGEFSINLRPRLNFSSFEIDNTFNDFKETEFDSQFNPSFGIETEFVFPINKNKWALFFEPTYHSYKTEKTYESTSVTSGNITAKVNYVSVELPIGVRHYFHLNPKSKLFLNTAFIYEVGTKKDYIEFKLNGADLRGMHIISYANFALGAGFKYHNKYSFEIRYIEKGNVLESYQNWTSSYNSWSFIFGYNLF